MALYQNFKGPREGSEFWLRLELGLGRGVEEMVRVKLSRLVIHYAYKGPHKDRSTWMNVCP